MIIEQMLSVFAVLLLLAGGLWVMRRKGLAQFSVPFSRPGVRKRLEVIERLPLSAQHSLHLVRCADQVLLVGLSPAGCNLLDKTQLTVLNSTPAQGPEALNR